MENFNDCSNCSHPVKEHPYKSNCNLCPCKQLKVYVSEEKKEELIRLREAYYSVPSIKYLIVIRNKCGMNKEFEKEFAILTKRIYSPMKIARLLTCTKYTQLDFYFENMSLFKAPFTNFYNSLAHLDTLPLTSMNLHLRTQEEIYAEFQDYWDEHIKGFDLLFDMDNQDINIAHRDTKILRKILSDYQIPFSTKFSGTKGFHIFTPYEWIASKDDKFPDFIGKIDYLLKEIQAQYEIESLDTSITDSKRVCKMPYTLDIDKIVLPLTDEQFDNFDIKKMTADYIFFKRNVEIANRGILLNTFGLTVEQSQKNFQKFVKDHI